MHLFQLDHLICEHAALTRVFLTHHVNSPTCDEGFLYPGYTVVYSQTKQITRLCHWGNCTTLHAVVQTSVGKDHQGYHPPPPPQPHVYLNFHGLVEVLREHLSAQIFAPFTPCEV